MQIEKFYKAQEVRREIVEMESALQSMETSKDVFSVLEKLTVTTRDAIVCKGVDVMKKEMQKLIKLKEKEFSEL